MRCVNKIQINIAVRIYIDPDTHSPKHTHTKLENVFPALIFDKGLHENVMVQATQNIKKTTKTLLPVYVMGFHLFAWFLVVFFLFIFYDTLRHHQQIY